MWPPCTAGAGETQGVGLELRLLLAPGCRGFITDGTASGMYYPAELGMARPRYLDWVGRDVALSDVAIVSG